MKAARIVLLTIAITGCSSGVLQLGPDLYRISEEGNFMGPTEAAAMRAAGQHCTGLGRRLDVQSMNGRPASFGQYAVATVNFRCIE